MRHRLISLLFLLPMLAACQNSAAPAEVTPRPDPAEIVLPDEHLIFTGQPTAVPTATAVPIPTVIPTATPPPAYQVQEGTLLARDAVTGDYAPDPAFPAELQGQVASVRPFTSVAGRYWVAFDDNDQAIAELFPDQDDAWINLLAMDLPAEAEALSLPNAHWQRELIGFSERDLVIVNESSGIANFEFLFVHAEWMVAQAGFTDIDIINAASLNKALNYLRATAANQGVLAFTENGLEIVPSKLPRGWRLQPDETGNLQLLDGAGQIVTGEEPRDYLLFEQITIAVSTSRPAVVLPMYRNTEDESETRHFLQAGQLLVHHYISERQLTERYIESGGDWQIAALGFRQAAILLANPRQLLAHIHSDWRGRLDRAGFPAGMTLLDFYDWYVEEPQRLDHYLLGRDPLHDAEAQPEAFDPLLEAEHHFPLRFRLLFAES
jgi:hypothetical protein